MGNHAAGGLIVGLVETMYDRRRPGETSLEIFDAAIAKAEEIGFSLDAEFDDAPYIDGPFRSALIEAFGQNYTPLRDEDANAFHEQVWEPFLKKYGFC